MPELELALRQLGGLVEFPPEPDLAAGVRRRLGEAPARRWAPRRLVAVALAVVVLAVAAAMAVPSARTAVLEWLGIKGVKVTRVDELPKVSLLSDRGLGDPVTLAEARRRAPGLVEPHLESLGAPDEVYFSAGVPGGQVTFLWGTKNEARLLMTQSPGEAFAEKMLGPQTEAEGARRRRAARSLVLGRCALLRLSRPSRQGPRGDLAPGAEHAPLGVRRPHREAGRRAHEELSARDRALGPLSTVRLRGRAASGTHRGRAAARRMLRR